MKHGLLFLILFFVQNALALYGAKVEVSVDSYVVSLHSNGKKFCNGLLISATKVLTAGHCIDVQDGENLVTVMASFTNQRSSLLKSDL